jgi:hypothetical protein
MPINYHPQPQIVENRVFDVDEMDWVAMTQTSVTVGELTVSGVAVSNLPENYDPSNYAVRLAEDGNILYVGEAPIGSATSSSVWRVKKVDTSSGVIITWAGGGAFNQIWNNYATLTYT